MGELLKRDGIRLEKIKAVFEARGREDELLAVQQGVDAHLLQGRHRGDKDLPGAAVSGIPAQQLRGAAAQATGPGGSLQRKLFPQRLLCQLHCGKMVMVSGHC